MHLTYLIMISLDIALYLITLHTVLITIMCQSLQPSGSYFSPGCALRVFWNAVNFTY